MFADKDEKPRALSWTHYELESCWAYDLEYRAYCQLQGPAFTLGNWLFYYDERSVHICGFHLTDTSARIGPAEVNDIIAHLDPAPRYVSVWGRLAPELRGHLAGGYTERQFLSNDERAAAEVIHLAEADPLDSSEVQRAVRRARRAGCTAFVTTADLGPEHYRILEEWIAHHDVSRLHRAFALSCLAQCAQGSASRFDIWHNNTLAGFAVVSFPTPVDAVYLQGFYAKGISGLSDAFLAEFVEMCKARNAERIHLGYSGSPGLRRFKTKWSGVTDERTLYEQVVFAHENERVPPGLSPLDAAVRSIWWTAEHV